MTSYQPQPPTQTPSPTPPAKTNRHPILFAFLALLALGGIISSCENDDKALTVQVAPTATGGTPPPPAAPSVTPAPAPDPGGTVSQQNALEQAESYLEYSSFSRSGLIGQLEYEGYSTDDATWAVDNVTVDWFEQAARTAASYMEYSSFSRSGLIDQLIYEGFTPEQAEHGANAVGL